MGQKYGALAIGLVFMPFPHPFHCIALGETWLTQTGFRLAPLVCHAELTQLEIFRGRAMPKRLPKD